MTSPESSDDQPGRPGPAAGDLTLDEKLRLFAGADFWNFAGVERLGIPSMQVADCGHGVTLVCPPYGSATCFPTSVGMAATWNRELLREVGRALGRETRAKNCGVLLGPMVNLHRLPCGGRNYETFSEDPVLTGRLAAAIVQGLQSEGTGGCVKSFACNNQQKNQQRTSAEVDPVTLRELYLKVYAVIFDEVEPWSVMTSYNPINGVHPSDSAYWLKEVLRGELGFQGVVVSDWHAVQGEGAIVSGLDIEMPGPGKTLIPSKLEAAHRDGRLDLDEINARAERILKIHEKARPAREGDERFSPPELNSRRHGELARQVAEEAIVLLQNREDMLPLRRDRIRRIAVIGPNAAVARLGGGGSASVFPPYAISPLEGIRAAAGEEIEVVHAEGCPLGDDLPAVPSTAFAPGPDAEFGKGLTGEYFTVEAFERDGAPTAVQTDGFLDFSWGWASPAEGLPRGHYAIRWHGLLRSPASGKVTLSISTREGIARAWIDGDLVLDCWRLFDPDNFEDRYRNRKASADIEMEAGTAVPIRIEFKKTGTKGAFRLGWTIPGEEDGIAAAEQMAAAADCAVVVGGLSNMFEGGTADRDSFGLPGRQEELIRRVAAANRRTVVVLKNGTPVSFRNWRDQVPAILEAFYPGQEGGHAIARVLFGDVNPSGRLPDTLPRAWNEVPAMSNYPGAGGKVHYAEGRMVGYRHYDRTGTEPEFPFGFGLSYSEFEYGSPALSSREITETEPVELTVTVTNTGAVAGKETVQLYFERLDPAIDQPRREVIDFSKIEIQPGESKQVSFRVHSRQLRHYDPDTQSWKPASGPFRLAVGRHSRDLQTVDCSHT